MSTGPGRGRRGLCGAVRGTGRGRLVRLPRGAAHLAWGHEDWLGDRVGTAPVLRRRRARRQRGLEGSPGRGVAELGYAVAPRSAGGSQRQSYESSSNALTGQVSGPSPPTPSPRKTRRPRCSSAADSPEPPSSSIPMRAQSGAGNSRSGP